MARNDESVLTDRFRALVAEHGGMSTKLSDKFTRGVPDLFTVFERVVFVEMKVDRNGSFKPIENYKRLGLSGAQDQIIRDIHARTTRAACVVNGEISGEFVLWVPVKAAVTSAKDCNYRRAASGNDGVIAWLKGQT